LSTVTKLGDVGEGTVQGARNGAQQKRIKKMKMTTMMIGTMMIGMSRTVGPSTSHMPAGCSARP
jgi:hypothetical protein